MTPIIRETYNLYPVKYLFKIPGIIQANQYI